MNKTESLCRIRAFFAKSEPVEKARPCRMSGRSWRSELRHFLPDDYCEPTISIIHQDDSVDIIRSVQKMTDTQWENFQHFHPKIASNLKSYRVHRNCRKNSAVNEYFFA